jgi:PAS domain S-box-containing protein
VLALLAPAASACAHGPIDYFSSVLRVSPEHDPATITSWVLFLAAVTLAGAVVWSRTLRRRVRTRTQGLSAEIMQLKAAQESLKASEERLDLALEAAQTGTWLWDVEAHRVTWDERVSGLFGLPAGTLGEEADSALARIHPDDRAAVDAQLEESVKTGERFDIGARIVRPDGEVRHVVFRGRVTRGAAGRAERVTGVAQDVTGAKRSEEEVARLTAAIRQATDAVVITDTQGVIQYVNPAFEAMTGYTGVEALGRPVSILKSGMHDAEFYATMWSRIRAGEPWQGHVVNRRKDGTLYEEETAITPVRDSSGTIVNYVSVKRDVTREVAMEAHMRQQQKLETLGLIASGIAHEINNPLTGVINYAQLIVDAAPAESETREFGQEIVRESGRMADMVRGMLSFARRDPRERSAERIVDIVRAARLLVRALMRHDQIALAVEVPEDLPRVVCRPQEVEQVVLNLLTNARDAVNARYPGRNPDKQVRVSACTVGEGPQRRVRLTVEDHGTGIPPENHKRIFEPFFTTKEHALGTGLGLAICADIIRDHGGDLTVESAEGGPTRFHLDLPAERKGGV